MGSIDEIRKDGDRVTVFVEGASATFILVNGWPQRIISSGGYNELFRWRPACQLEHETAAMEEFIKPSAEAAVKSKNGVRGKKLVKRKKRKKKEIIDPYELNKNPYPINPASFPVDENGEYAGVSIEVIYNFVSALYRERKLSGEARDYREMAGEALKNLGFTGKNLGAVHSAISKEMWRRRKRRETIAKERKIQEAREAEMNHCLPLET